MANDKEIILLESLIDRIERDPQSGKRKLDGAISEKEFEALKGILSEVGGNPPTEQSTPSSSDEDLHSYELNLSSLELSGPEDMGVLLALDFGTAMSKAFATDGGDEDLVELALGKRAGHTDVIFPVASSVFISDQGQVYFGPDAISRSLQAPDGERERLDSPKQILSQGEISDLFDSAVSKKVNPSTTPITKGDLITLYLAYLTDLASTELQDRHGKSRHVLRCFARPSWKLDRAEWAEKQLVEMLADAQILADTLSGRWTEGMPVSRLKATVDEVRKLNNRPTFLIGDGVLEAIASGSSSLHNAPRGKRAYFMIVDIGAGTSDFGLFVVVKRADDESVKVARIDGSVQTLEQAGDTVDTLLRMFVLDQIHAKPGDPYFERLNTGLVLRIRQYKEDLFRNEQVRYDLADGAAGYVQLDDFLSQKGIEGFERNLRDKFKQALEGIDESWLKEVFENGLYVVFTGGGASLPMVQKLGEGIFEIQGRNIQLTKTDLVPEWIRETYPELSDEYPQLAVAIGASAKDLPAQAPDQANFGGRAPAPKGGFETVYRGS
jgi:hypothetical protein